MIESPTKWKVTHNGDPLTWSRLSELWQLALVVYVGDHVPTKRREHADRLLQEVPVQFDVADQLSSRQAQQLVSWLKGWMGAEHGLRLAADVSTGDLRARLPHEGGKPVRV